MENARPATIALNQPRVNRAPRCRQRPQSAGPLFTCRPAASRHPPPSLDFALRRHNGANRRKIAPNPPLGLSHMDFFSGRIADIPDSRSRNSSAFVAELRIRSWLSAKIRPIASESINMR